MKKDYKVGMVVGLVVVMILAVGWVVVRGRPAPQAANAQGTHSTVRPYDPNRVRPNYPVGSQPYAAAPAMPGPGATTVSLGVRQEPNAVPGQLPGSPVTAAAPAPGAASPQAQVPATPTPVPAVAPSKPARTHVVRDGETLSDISDHYYGSPNRWEKIVRANRSTIKDADKIYPGMKLVIPE